MFPYKLFSHFELQFPGNQCLFYLFSSKYLDSEYKSKLRLEEFSFLFAIYEQYIINLKQQMYSFFMDGFLPLGEILFVGNTLRSIWMRLRMRGQQKQYCWGHIGKTPCGKWLRDILMGSWYSSDMGQRNMIWPPAIQIQAHSHGCYQQITVNYRYLSDGKLPSKLGRKPPRVWEHCSLSLF